MQYTENRFFVYIPELLGLGSFLKYTENRFL